jgi:hypothetical protein
VLTGILTCHPLEVFDECFLAVRDRRIVLSVRRSNVSPNGFSRPIALQRARCRSQAAGLDRRATPASSAGGRSFQKYAARSFPVENQRTSSDHLLAGSSARSDTCIVAIQSAKEPGCLD